jgi:putative hydrolase of HD superfamily
VKIESLLRFYARAAALKLVDRAGWARCGVSPCESVADHTFGVALLALLLPKIADSQLDRDRCIALALVHDLAESVVGDITPHDGVEAAEKHAREERAMRELADTLGDDQILQLWLEFEDAQTPEAQFVRDLDVVEMALQAKAYERAGALTADRADGFFESARSRVTTDVGRSILDSLPK